MDLKIEYEGLKEEKEQKDIMIQSLQNQIN